MKSLLIVEDEKIIRQGVRMMVSRSSVEVEEIIESKNGEEALEILKARHVDVMITDMRMPKMDGIALVKKAGELKHPPKIIVLSGYDDFHYAVEVLKNGARDYILKPIDREKVQEILQQLEDEILEEEKGRIVQHQMTRQQMKYYLIHASAGQNEIMNIKQQLETDIFEESYVACCVRPMEELISNDFQFVQLNEIEEQTILFVREQDVQRFVEVVIPGECCGMSGSYWGLDTMRVAYKEAREARNAAFIRCKEQVCQQIPDTYEEHIPEEFANHFVQRFGTDSMEKDLNQLKTYFFHGKVGKIEAQEVLNTDREIWQKIYQTYKNVIEMDITNYARWRQPLYYKNAKEYLEGFTEWLLQIKQLLTAEFVDYRNKEKMNQAMAYIHENYNKNLNMAVVSNYVSMNYSLFSVTFKQYTGKNFVSYVKSIRLSEAKKLLAETETKVIDISQQIGYDNEKHFMKLFKAMYGVSPTEYRKNIQIGKS
ncbi:MAG: response regulator [Hespellia sp.]|nr:response regulator [Hespellia sp.]